LIIIRIIFAENVIRNIQRIQDIVLNVKHNWQLNQRQSTDTTKETNPKELTRVTKYQDRPNYEKFNYCNVCKINVSKKDVYCPDCKNRVRFGARKKKIEFKRI
jgi:hypothetical protein